MYIGIYINDSYISAAYLSQDDSIVYVKDNTLDTERSYLHPLKIYIEDNFTYLGNQINYLLSNDYDLNYCYDFLKKATNDSKDTIVYKDNTDRDWGISSILSVFLKKLKSDLLVYDDKPIQGAVVSISNSNTTSITKIIKQAFDIADIPLCEVLSIGKAALLGTEINMNYQESKMTLVYNLDPRSLSISLMVTEGDGYIEKQFIEINRKLGEFKLLNAISTFFIKEYQSNSGFKIRKNKKNNIKTFQVAKKIVSEYLKNQSKLYIKVVCDFDNTVNEILFSTEDIKRVLLKYLEECVDFFEKTLTTKQIHKKDIDNVLIAGTASSGILIQSEKHLNQCFDANDVLHKVIDPSKIILKGVTLYANDHVEREINSSLNNKVYNEKSDTDDPNKNDQIKNLKQIVNSLQINMGCDS